MQRQNRVVWSHPSALAFRWTFSRAGVSIHAYFTSFPRFSLETSFSLLPSPVLASRYMFSRACFPLYMFIQRPSLVSWPAMFSRDFRPSHGFSCPGIPLNFSPALATRYLPPLTCFPVLAYVSCFIGLVSQSGYMMCTHGGHSAIYINNKGVCVIKVFRYNFP